ncbi:hypothetical protein [Acidovorax sp.]|uniref:hypothetical protein n=1 Tax=Acidovorax sp. TaxID=1872122 RepID=UPI0025C268BD|nr:hypothetical protein [Acidovorax sp.]
MAKISDGEMERYRAMDCALALPMLTEHCKQDRDFTALKNVHTHRWHVSAAGNDYEILTTGPKWFDARASVGGGGAIDLAMHLHRLNFKQAIAKLREVSK